MYLDANDITEVGAGYLAEYFNYLADTGKTGLQYLFFNNFRIIRISFYKFHMTSIIYNTP